MFRIPFTSLFVIALLLIGSPASLVAEEQPLVIAHRGASGYLPEHTLEATALAYAMRPDYIEQDLVLSKDDHLIVMHDLYLDNITDVASRYPEKARADGHFYAIDFTLAELKTLQVTSPFFRIANTTRPRFAGRFPLWKSSFELATFEEAIELIQGLNKTLGYDIGIYPEIKKPWFHHREGKDIARRALETLKQYGYTQPQDKVFLQSFDANELQRVRSDLLPEMDMDIALVQLIAENDWNETMEEEAGRWAPYDYSWMLTAAGLEKIAGYAQGVGPALGMLKTSDAGRPFVELARQNQLQVHPFTLRADALAPFAGLPTKKRNRMPAFEQTLVQLRDEHAIDGIFTDQPDRARQVYSSDAQISVESP